MLYVPVCLGNCFVLCVFNSCIVLIAYGISPMRKTFTLAPSCTSFFLLFSTILCLPLSLYLARVCVGMAWHGMAFGGSYSILRHSRKSCYAQMTRSCRMENSPVIADNDYIFLFNSLKIVRWKLLEKRAIHICGQYDIIRNGIILERSQRLHWMI